MIGLAANPMDAEIAQEFFELFKTHWEWAVPGRKYDAVLSTHGDIDKYDAQTFLVYGSEISASDRRKDILIEEINGPIVIEWGPATVPVYGRLALFKPGGDGTLKYGDKTIDHRYRCGSRVVWRVGYDLFDEIRHLLTEGQPVAHALTPTLELHIEFLRHLLAQSGAPFVEIPARPHEYDFICCLTHDLDFVGIRRQKLDRTLAGFVSRATIGSLLDLVRGRRPVADVARNWLAVLSLPLVFLGLARDFWNPFDDYVRADQGRRSTFFVVPFKGRPGKSPAGVVDRSRAVAYEVSELHQEVTEAAGRGAELALHGIDAWRDAAAGRVEMNKLTSLTGQASTGVRMHWLYFADHSPQELEAAGFAYDSTCGYNDAVGYRAGTSQAFRLFGTEGLMELPLSIMDSALFYPGRMGLASEDALDCCFGIVANARRFGGTVVVNWHDRSLAPERLWGRSYQALVDETGSGDRAWFCTAGEAVEWFRWRRTIRFTEERTSNTVTVSADSHAMTMPSAMIRVHRPGVAANDCRLDAGAPMTVQL